MNPQEAARRREAIVREHGPWTGNNIRVAEGVYTMEAGLVGAAEQNVARAVQIVCDVLGPDLSGVRVLDLACMEGLYGIEFALQGAEVVAIEGREPSVAKARFAAEALGLSGYEVRQGDVRELGEDLGSFDVVLCLGILYHLEAGDALALVRDAARLATRVALVETQISLTAERSHEEGGRTYWGKDYAEPETPWASIGNRSSFWFTRASLLNGFTDAGFTSVMELRAPAVPEIAAFEDHVSLLALRGAPVTARVSPEAGELEPERNPERLPRHVHPSQNTRGRVAHAARTALRRRAPHLFRKRRAQR